MPLKRRVSKEREFVVTDTAVQLYTEMKFTCGCSCRSHDDWIYNRECEGCRRWWDLQQLLWRELGLRLWQWPAISRSGRPGDYDGAREVWERLEQAARHSD